MFNYKILPNRDLKITASNKGRQEIAVKYQTHYTHADILSDIVKYLGLKEIHPDWIAALTDAPIVGDDTYWDDDGVFHCQGNVWWYRNYMRTDPMEQLKNKGRVIFQWSDNS